MNDNPFRIEPSWPRDSMCAMTGSPRSRERTESIRSTLLGRVSGFVRCPRVIRLGLRFEKGDDPVTVITNMLAEDGYLNLDALRCAFKLPETRLICRPLCPVRGRLCVRTASRRRVLKQALMLGLCTNQVFDPGRPVLWTATSLTRTVELFDHRGFYA